MTFFIFIGRVFSLPIIFVKYAIQRTYADEAGRKIKLDNPERLRLVFEDLGGVFMKFGQILAMRFDILPLRYAMALLNLLDNARPVANAEMFQIFREEAGKDIKEVFENINEKPLATASFAQVYEADYQGQKVIVKIQKPLVQKYIKADIALLKFLSYFIDKIGLLKAVSMKEVVWQLKEWLKDELDYTIEAHNNEVLYEHAQKHKLEEVVIPKVYPALTTKKVLVQEFLTGSQVKKIIVYLATRPEDVKKILDERNINLLEASNRFIRDLMRQFFIDKYAHADPHPANLFIFPESKIGYIDFGIIGKSIYDNYGLLRFIKGATDLDFALAGEGIVEFADTRFSKELGDVLNEDQKTKDIYEKTLAFISQKLSQDMTPIIKDWHFFTGNKTLNLSKRSSAVAFFKIVKAAEKYKIKFPPDVIAFIRSLVIIDMVCLKLTSDFDMVKAAKTFFDKYSLEGIKEMGAEHAEEIVELKDFAALYADRVLPEKAGAAATMTEEKRYANKERFMGIVSALAEKYPELYNEIKEVK